MSAAFGSIQLARLLVALGIVSALPAPLRAQGHVHGAAPADTTTPAMEPAMEHRRHGAAMDHAAMNHEVHAAPGFYGPYSVSREASGTSWQPEAVPHRGYHRAAGPWTLMAHGFATVIRDEQQGPRGATKTISTSMLMGLASRALGPGRLGLRAMLSADPWGVGQAGYPLLLQSGETADGLTELTDRQHPHDLFIELATSFSASSGSRSAFAYFGYPGEPALGPPVFMHRASGEEFPDSPITHHWLDSTHITWGVFTAGVTDGPFKLEASRFTGREPDQHRKDFEEARWDSWSVRATANPGREWSLQLSHGHIESPEQLQSLTNTDRTTASIAWAREIRGRLLAATFAWGRNRNQPGRTLDGALLEATAHWSPRHTTFVRAERVEKDELFEDGAPLGDRAFTVGRAQAGYLYDWPAAPHLSIGAGIAGTVNIVPKALEPAYDRRPLGWMAMLRARII